MVYPSFFDFADEFYPCECCRPRFTTTTFTVGTPRRWTEKEIRDRLIELARELTIVRWYDRGDVRRQIKHWSDKLERLQNAVEEFALQSVENTTTDNED